MGVVSEEASEVLANLLHECVVDALTEDGRYGMDPARGDRIVEITEVVHESFCGEGTCDMTLEDVQVVWVRDGEECTDFLPMSIAGILSVYLPH